MLGAEWTPEARDVLAHAWNAEADWSDPDHRAIGFVFLRRWEQSHGKLSFPEIIRRYVSAYATKHPTARHLRVLATDESCAEPPGWDRTEGAWESYAEPRCKELWKRIDQWAAGELKDPCRGEPTNFGGAMDSPNEKLVQVHCDGTANRFYALKSRVVSAALAKGP